jgi:hypothetical protein
MPRTSSSSVRRVSEIAAMSACSECITRARDAHEEINALREDAEWRDRPNSSRGHHDFQSRVIGRRNRPTSLHLRGFWLADVRLAKFANCGHLRGVGYPARSQYPNGRPPGRAELAGRRSLIGAVADSGMHAVRMHAVRPKRDARPLVEHFTRKRIRVGAASPTRCARCLAFTAVSLRHRPAPGSSSATGFRRFSPLRAVSAQYGRHRPRGRGDARRRSSGKTLDVRALAGSARAGCIKRECRAARCSTPSIPRVQRCGCSAPCQVNDSS